MYVHSQALHDHSNFPLASNHILSDQPHEDPKKTEALPALACTEPASEDHATNSHACNSIAPAPASSNLVVSAPVNSNAVACAVHPCTAQPCTDDAGVPMMPEGRSSKVSLHAQLKLLA